MKVCQYCGHPLKDDAKFCSFCGKSQAPPKAPEAPASDISAPGSAKAEQPAAPKPPDSFCPNCGAPLKPGAAFCSRCGVNLQQAAALDTALLPDGLAIAPQPEEPAKKSKKPLIVLAAASAVLIPAAAFSLYWGYRFFSTKSLMDKGKQYAQEGDYEQAISSYEEALEISPDKAEAVVGLAEACLKEENYSKALSVLNHAEIDEDDPLYADCQALSEIARFQPEIDRIDTKNFPTVTVTIDYNGDVQLSQDAINLREGETERAVSDFQMKDGRITISYESEESENSEEKRDLAVTLDLGGYLFRNEENYNTPVLVPAQIDLVSTDVSQYPLVKTYFRVEDADSGNVVEGLGPKSFVIQERIEGGEFLAREVHAVQPLEGNVGLNIAMAADKSSSISDSDMNKIKQIMIEFVNSLHYGEGDKAEVLAFDSIVQQMCYFTDNSTLLGNGINNMSTDGRTAFYDAVYDGITHTALQGGARCVIAFTDGNDNESRHNANDVIAYANAKQVPLYIIGVGYDVEAWTLESIADGTGGHYWFIDDLYDLQDIFDQIYADQKKLYSVEYISDASLDAYLTRELEVKVSGCGHKAQSLLSFEPVHSIGETTHASRYEVIKEALTWEQATERCQEMGGHLATITSQEEMNQLTSMADGAGLRYVWLGGYTSYDNYSNVFGHWVTGEDFSYQAWSPEEPSRVDKDGTPEWYIMLWNIPQLGGWSWNDQRNDPVSAVASMAQEMGFICEFE